MVSVLILLSGCRIRTVYIVGVWLIGAKHPMLQLKRLFFVTKKNLFFKKFVESSCKEGRGQTMRGSGQNMVQNDQIQRASVYMI